MRTKTLLIAAAALAATVISSKAQVYSANIVGYTTQTLTISNQAWVNVSTPLDLTDTSGNVANTLTNLFPNPGPGGGNNPLDFDKVYIWNGAGYNIYTLDSDFPSGVGNALDNAGVPAPIVPPGSLVYIDNNGGNVNGTTTNILSGLVHTEDGGLAAAAGRIGVTTNKLVAGLNFVASKLPVGGGITSALGLTNNVAGGNGGPNSGTGPLDFSQIYVPNISNGKFLGYNIYTFDSDFSTGFGNALDNAQVAEPQIPVGTGFIIKYVDNNGQGPYYWIQND